MSFTLIATLVALFASIAILVGVATSSVLASMSTERRRLRTVTRPERRRAVPEILSISSGPKDSSWQRIATLIHSPKAAERLRLRLARAGFRHASAPVIYTLLEWSFPLAAAAVPLFYLSGQLAWIFGAGAAIVGYFIPSMIVDQRLAKRRREIENGLPDALDLLVVCIEAGSGLDQAIVKTSDELAITYPALAEEFRMLTTEIRAGKPRMEAFKSLAQRTKVDDVRAMVAMLIQTDRFGTSVGQALRTHADTSRTKRRQRAEERAQQLAVKLVFPLVLCFFPALYVVVLGPAVIQLIRTFLHR
jgi:tight adherence protein C